MAESVWGAPNGADVEPDAGRLGERPTGPGRAVEIAVDAPGANRTYTYVLPDRLADVAAGEAVLVEYGRARQALGIVMGPAAEVPGAGEEMAGPELKPVLARVRADGPLLPELSLRFARWIWLEYLAPPAAVLRSMLPPGMLERLELVAEKLPPEAGTQGGAPLDGAELGLLEALGEGPRAVPDIDADEGRPATLRRLRSMAARGLVRLEWTLTAAAGGPRFERWIMAAGSAGSAGCAGSADGGGEAGQGPARLGPRQRALLADLAAAGQAGLSGAVAAEKHGAATSASLERRGLVRIELRERPRRPLREANARAARSEAGGGGPHRRPGRGRGVHPHGGRRPRRNPVTA